MYVKPNVVVGLCVKPSVVIGLHEVTANSLTMCLQVHQQTCAWVKPSVVIGLYVKPNVVVGLCV